MKLCTAVYVIGILFCVWLPCFSQLNECRIDFNVSGDGTDDYSGNTWNLKNYTNTSALALKNIDNTITGGASVRLNNYDDKISSGAWGLGSVGWIYSASGAGADQLFYTFTSGIPSYIYLENIPDAIYRIDLVASYSYSGDYYASDYQIGSDFGVVRGSDGNIVVGETGLGFNPNTGYDNGWYISWSDIEPSDGNITIQISGNNHNIINAMRIVKTGDASLPVDLSLYRVIREKEKFVLQWTTASEQDNLGFEILRSDSRDGEFTCIASYITDPNLKSNGNSTIDCNYKYTDRETNQNSDYWYKLVDVSISGDRTTHKAITTDQSSVNWIPRNFEIYQNYPNPFNPTTRISFDLPVAGSVQLIIYNMQGQPVRNLFDEIRDTGHYFVDWNAQDDSGNALAGGVYIARLSFGGYSQSIKLLYMK